MKRLALIALVAACGPSSMFRLSSPDNIRGDLETALARRQLPAQDSPINVAQQPRVFVVQGGPTKSLVAYDLAASRVLWKTAADVQSRIWVGGDFIIAGEGKQLVARDQQTGAARWSVAVAGELVGGAADRERAYMTWREGSTWHVAGYAGSSGKQLWHEASDGALGGPVAQGGVVFVPYYKQWLYLIDGASGTQLARLRDESQIAIVRAKSRLAYFGSSTGMVQLDVRATVRGEASVGVVKVPPQLQRASYGIDLYDAVQVAYTAADRTRLVWSAPPADRGPLQVATAVHYFRYVLGFDREGQLTWAYSHPRVELVATEHTGRAIAGISANGELVVLDPATGALRATQSLGLAGPALGATFDADGWSPAGEGKPVETVAALVTIARDRDARFDGIKELAIKSLAKLSGAEVTTQLLAVLADARAPMKLKETAAEMLALRKDPASLAVLTAQLAVHTDYLAKTEARSLGPVATAIASLAGTKLDPAHVRPAVEALHGHLEDPATQTPDLVLVIRALTAIGGGAERRMLASHLLLYHADDDIGGDATWQKTIVAALKADREILRQVAQDPRTEPGLMQAIKETLVKE